MSIVFLLVLHIIAVGAGKEQIVPIKHQIEIFALMWFQMFNLDTLQFVNLAEIALSVKILI